HQVNLTWAWRLMKLIPPVWMLSPIADSARSSPFPRGILSPGYPKYGQKTCTECRLSHWRRKIPHGKRPMASYAHMEQNPGSFWRHHSPPRFARWFLPDWGVVL